MQKQHQFICLLGYGRQQRKGCKPWECITGITEEGARAPAACNHVRNRREAVVLYGGSPADAGRLAIERADNARDHGDRFRKLRLDGNALFSGVASYPIARSLVETDPDEKKIYVCWRAMTVEWLIRQFGHHLKSVVEHVDEGQLHLHFYIVPDLGNDKRLNVPAIHPGFRMKYDAADAGAKKRDQDAAYRAGMSRWQDDYWYDVSRVFGHKRFGPKRTRLNRMRYLFQKKMEEERAQQLVAIETAREQAEKAALARRSEQDREFASRLAGIEQRERNYAEELTEFNAGLGRFKAVVNEERTRRRAAEDEVARLRARLAELEPEPPSAAL